MQIKDYPLITTIANPDLLLVQTANDSAYKSIEVANLVPSASSSSSNQIFPNSFSHWHDESVVKAGNQLLTDNYSNYPYATQVYQNPPALNDVSQFNKVLDIGNYNIFILGVQGSNRGILHLSVNDSNAANDLDFYSGGYTSITLSTIVNITTAGMQLFKLTTINKNPASSNYYIVLTKLWGIKQ